MTPLQQMLIDARDRTLALVSDLEGDRLFGPRLSIVNPPLWELGHLAWFQERWCLRRQDDETLAPSLLTDADRLYDSSAVAHDLRWDLPLPSLTATLGYLRAVLDGVLERSANAPLGDPDSYFMQLAAFHEEMHAEAFTYTRQTLGYAAPAFANAIVPDSKHETLAGDAEIAGGEFFLGAHPGPTFVFDNEKWAHRVRIEPFRISRVAVTNRDYAAFVDDGGYRRRELWCTEGWAWRVSADAQHPVYWQRSDGDWLERSFDTREPLNAALPVMHVNWHEARAYCRWAGRRLPTEAEWEYAAATAPGDTATKRRYPWGDASPTAERANLFGTRHARMDAGALPAGDSAWGCRQMIGNTWEWTENTFQPYPGFVVDPYKEYSQPWFGDHKVLRGGCYATRACLIRNTWRNFYTPDRRDVFAGFRTCAR